MNKEPSLRDIYLSHTGKGSDKWCSYLHAYERALLGRRERVKSILEIGVQNGGSLEIWSKYLPIAEHVVGVDINPKVSWLEFNDARIRAMVGDAASKDMAEHLKTTYPDGFDIVIDDGSHHSGDIVRSFALLFEQVKVGGVYAAEDLHCSYWAGWEGGLYDPFSSLNFFKRLVDIVNFEHWGVPGERAMVLESFAAHYGTDFVEEQLAQIKRVEFVNSICFIYKSDPSETVMEPRMFTGEQEGVEHVAHLIAEPYAPPSQVDNLWSKQSSSFEAQLQEFQRIKDALLASETQIAQTSGEHAEALRASQLNHEDLLQQVRSSREESQFREIDLLQQIHSAREESQLREEDLLQQVHSVRQELVDRQTQHETQLSTSVRHADQLRSEITLLKGQLDQYSQNYEAIRTSLTWRTVTPVREAIAPIYKTGRFFKKVTRLLGTYSIGEAAKLSTKVLKEKGIGGLITTIQKSGVPRGDEAVLEHQVDAKVHGDIEDYKRWLEKNDPLDSQTLEDLKGVIHNLPLQPLISVVMPVYNPPIEYIDAAIESLRAQVYENWELCIADDASPRKEVRIFLENAILRDKRIKVIFRESNGHISQASNSALTLASGEFIALMDNDDVLPPHALAHVVIAINEKPAAEIIYSDEDKIDEEGRRYAPYFKPDFNYELFLAQNMVSHLGVYRRSTLLALGGFRNEFEGAQDWDLALRVLDQVGADKVVHIPRVLYHWRAFEGSTALDSDEKPYVYAAQQRAVREHLQRRGVEASVGSIPENRGLLRVRFSVKGNPKVSIIIPTKNKVELLRTCISSVLEKSTYENYEILVVDNGSDEPETLEYLRHISSDKVRIINAPIPFNYSRLNNIAAAQAHGDYLCLMNNDIEIISPDWMEEMLGFASQTEVGCVGARLWYPNNTLQHAGVVLGVLGVAGHAFKGITRNNPGYFGRAWLHQSYSAVTAACLMIKKSIYTEVNGLDESFAVAFNDVDFCIRVRETGYRNVWTPFAEMYHHESASRGYEDNPEKQKRFMGEVGLMQSRWGEVLKKDFAYNPNLTLNSDDYSIAPEARVGD